MNNTDIIVFWSDPDWGLKYFSSNIRKKNCSFKKRRAAVSYAKKNLYKEGIKIVVLNKDCQVFEIIE